MIEFLSSWAKGLAVTIVIVSIFEMLLPNNKTKKYITMVLGIYVIFNMVAPFIKSKEIFNLEKFDLKNFKSVETTSNVNQKSMDERIQKLYEEELQKNIIKRLEEQGYKVTMCKVKTQLIDEKSQISKIKLNVEKNEKNIKTDTVQEEKIINEIQKIKKVDTKIQINNEEKVDSKKIMPTKITNQDIKEIKEILSKEYGVKEKCLEIN